MKAILLLIVCFLYSSGYGQRMELKDLTALLDVPANRLDNILQKKGFRKDAFLQEGTVTGAFRRSNKEGSCVQFVWMDDAHKCVYETNSAEEFTQLKSEIRAAGFTAFTEDSAHIQSRVYQKQVFTIETASRTEDSTVIYSLKASKKDLPKLKDLLFAEDLLALDSHEYLTEMFGKSNVRASYFFYAEDDSSRCTVIFPGTNREAIIIWKDEDNLRHIAFIVIGGRLRPDTKPASTAQGFNNWRSRQGAYCGMSLKELEMLNREPVRFFNWHSESAGYLVPKNKGALDFKQLGVVLSCMNCGFIKVSQGAVVDSETALKEMQKVFVSSMIIMAAPE